jgi:retron-type reverse transcriptase
MGPFVPNKNKVHSLTGRITPALMHAAFKAVKRNRGAAGIDRVSIKMFEANLQENLDSLMRALKDGSFEPKPLRRKFIDKGGGKLRPLGIPVVRDRVGQEVLRRLLAPIFEPKFHDWSYGSRPGRNGHMAIAQALRKHASGYKTVLDADITGFFDNLPHLTIMAAVAAEIADGNILNLIEKFLRWKTVRLSLRRWAPRKGVSFRRSWLTSFSITWIGRFTNMATALCGMSMILWCSPFPRPRLRRHWLWLRRRSRSLDCNSVQ